MNKSKKYKVLIIDDSALTRQILSQILSSDPEIDVIGTAHDPIFAARKIMSDPPDVITLDINMPRMDGITFLKHLMNQKPLPVVIISGITEQDSILAMQALELGAVEVINKPSNSSLEEFKIRICDSIKAAAQAKIIKRKFFIQKNNTIFYPKIKNYNVFKKNSSYKVIAIGASTGGTEAIKSILEKLDINTPGIVIVQHMPEKFTYYFANRLNDICKIKVKEAESGDLVEPGIALIAPGNKHMTIKKSNDSFYVELSTGPLVNRHRPSVDVLFESVAAQAEDKAIGIILTGMGNDGAKGLLKMKEAGSFTIAQDKNSSVVFGMPQEAIKIGASDIILDLNEIPSFLINELKIYS